MGHFRMNFMAHNFNTHPSMIVNLRSFGPFLSISWACQLTQQLLVGGFKYFFFSSLIWENDPIWRRNIFQMGFAKCPPTFDRWFCRLTSWATATVLPLQVVVKCWKVSGSTPWIGQIFWSTRHPCARLYVPLNKKNRWFWRVWRVGRELGVWEG